MTVRRETFSPNKTVPSKIIHARCFTEVTRGEICQTSETVIIGNIFF